MANGPKEAPRVPAPNSEGFIINWIVLLMAGSVEQELYKDTKVDHLTKRKLSGLGERLYIRTHHGDVAQLARALDWQSRGRRFEPDLLHNPDDKCQVFFMFNF
jgi:hypothetical protein